jgi:hypothetical protein
MWPFRKRTTQSAADAVKPAADGITITPSHIEKAADHLMRCSALGGRDGILFDTFVVGDVWYDRGRLAVFFGLDPRYDEHVNVVYSYLGLIFCLAADNAVRRGLGRTETRSNGVCFVLTKEGRQKYPSPPEEDLLLGEER